MKRILIILVLILGSWFLSLIQAQLVQPVKWSGEEIRDSVRLRADIEPGWHLTIIEMGDFVFTQELKDSFEITLAKTDLIPIRFNACNDNMCTAPEIWEYTSLSSQSE
ncbi:MAG: hypothetical protein IKS76_06405, partial [Paludibacteraceae bacterium]|nr:hypothetical protein [Paludibacteraceae bacterium]